MEGGDHPEGRGKEHFRSMKGGAIESIPEWGESTGVLEGGLAPAGSKRTCMGLSSKRPETLSLLFSAVFPLPQIVAVT